MLTQVVAELRASHPGRTIDTDFQLDEPIEADRQRMAQLLSNLLGNALTHGAANIPVQVRATAASGQFELTVTNGGPPIPAATMPHLFHPFFRGVVRPSQEGLGLGLFIASEIARAHHGKIDVSSTGERTRFAFRMPNEAASPL